MVQIKILASANLAQAQAQFAALTAEVEAMNKAMARSSMVPMRGTAKDFGKISSGANAASRAFNNVLASSGAFRVEQLKINDAVAHHTELLSRQKLGFNQVFGKKSQLMMKEVYMEQLAMQKATARFPVGGIGDGKTRMTMAIPSSVPKSWDTLNNRIGMFRYRLASASQTLLNWGKNTQWAGRQLTAGLTMPVAAFGAVAAVMAYKTDAAMQKIVKVYDFSTAAMQDASVREKEANDLRSASLGNAVEAAKKYGAQLTATLDVEQQLAATGLKGSNLFQTTNQVQRISTIGDIDPTKTTEMVVALQTAFKKTITDGDDLNNVLNFMNATSNATSLSLQDIAEATPRAATAIAQLGGTAQEMTVLLVSMREAGIDAAQGANALKSATTRIINPVKKATEFYDQYGISLENLATKSGGNIYQYLQMLGKEQQKIQGPTEKQTALLRAQGVAALFGTYQNNRLTASLVNMTDALSGTDEGANQTRKAMELMGMSAADAQKQADASLRDVTDSASGRFKIALASIQAELASFGEPFLKVATVFLKVTSTILGFFNSLPGGVKKMAAFALIMGALVGPVIMIIGLLANFAANIGKVSAWALKSVTSFRLMTREQWASEQAAKMADTAFQKEASSAEILTAQLTSLTAAIKAEAIARYEAARIPMPAGLAPLPNKAQFTSKWMSDNTIAGSVRDPSNKFVTLKGEALAQKANLAYYDALMRKQVQSNDLLQERNHLLPIGPARATISEYASSTMASMQDPRGVIRAPENPMLPLTGGGRSMNNMAGQQAAAIAINKEVDKAIKAGTIRTAQGQKLLNITEKTQGAMSGAAVSAGVMGASMALMMMPVSETTKNIAKWAMIGALVVPAVKSLVTVMLAASAASAKFLTAQRLNMAAASGGLGKMAVAGAGVKGALLGIGKSIGAAGVITIGITAAVAGVMMWRNHMKEVAAAQKEVAVNQAALLSQTDAVAASQENVINTWQRFQDMQASAEATNKFNDRVDFYKSEDQKKATDSFADFSAPQQQDLLADKYIQNIKTIGMTASESAAEVKAFLFATGMGMDEATAGAQKLLTEFGSLKNADWTSRLQDSLDTMFSNTEELAQGNKDVVIEAGKQAGRYFAEGFIGASNAQSGEQVKMLKDQIVKGYEDINSEDIFKNIKMQATTLPGVETDQLEGLLNDSEKLMEYMDSLSGDDLSKALELLGKSGSAAYYLEQSLIGGAAAALGLSSDVDTLAEFLKESRVQAQLMTFDDAKTSFQSLLDAANPANLKPTYDAMVASGMISQNQADKMLETSTENGHETARIAINAWNAAHGLKEGATYTQAWFYFLNKSRVETEKTADGIDKIGRKLSALEKSVRISISIDETKGAIQDSMAGVQDDIANNLSDDLDARAQASADSVAKYWNARKDALDAAQDRANDAFDERWTRRKDAMASYWDNRIESVDKAIEAEQKAEEIRQRIFEAEQTRLDRLTESANRTIDFNVALQTGSLDEAAKIRNDMDAAAQGWALSDGAAKGARGSEKRVNNLNDTKDSLSKARDAAMDDLDKREDMERKHLDKIQAMRQDALDAQAQAAEDANQAEWDSRKDSLDAQLETFKSFVPKNQHQLELWMKEMSKTYEGFGTGTLDPLSQQWGKFFQKSFQSHIRDAGLKIGSDNMWEKMGKNATAGILEGMGFPSMSGFKSFIMTGKLPSDFGTHPDNKTTVTPGRPGEGTDPIIHGGGWVGSAKSNRRGVARNIKGVGPGEQRALLRKKEFVVNEHSAKKYAPQLEAMNKGIYDPTPRGVMGGAGPQGPAGLMMGAFGIGVTKVVGAALAKAASAKITGTSSGSSSAIGSGYTPGTGSKTPPLKGNPSHGSVHDEYTGFPAVDFGTAVGTPVYAVANGIISAYKEYKGNEPRNDVQNGYYSYGKVLYLKTDSGPTVLMAHLSDHFVKPGQRVKGGAKIAATGNTGHSTGAHLHFGANGPAPQGPLAWLKKGGTTLSDGIAMLHRGETVLTEDLTDDLKNTVRAFGRVSKDVISGKAKSKSKNIGDAIGSSSESWKNDTTKADASSSNGGWTYLSGLFQTIAKGKEISAPSAEGSINSGTFNMGTGSNEKSKVDLSKLMQQADVLSLEEVSSKKRALIPWIESQGWGFFGSKPGPGLAWNKSALKMTASGEKPLSEKGSSFHRNAVYGKFSGAGADFWQIAAHAIAWPYKTAARRKTQDEQFRNLRDLWGSLHKDGTPVILGGDMNESIARGDWIKKIGLGEGTNSGPGTHNKDWLDHLFSVGLTAGEQRVIAGLSSDHNAVLNTFSIPSHKNGAQNIRMDDTLINAHKGEGILTEEQNTKFRYLANNIDEIAMGGGNEYNVTVQVTNPSASADEIANKVIQTIKKQEARKPQRRS